VLEASTSLDGSDFGLNLPTLSSPLHPRPFEPAPAPRLGRGRFGVAPWLVVGSGVVSLGGALGPASHAETTAQIAGGLGGTLVLAGTLMLLVDDPRPSTARIGLGCNLRGCFASARGSF
jgi:hypothetical protein